MFQDVCLVYSRILINPVKSEPSVRIMIIIIIMIIIVIITSELHG